MKSSDSSIAESLARFVKEYSFKELPDDIVSQARLSILDLIGVTIRGSLQESTQIARDLVLACGSGLQSTLLGTGQKVSALDAAFVNGISAHSLELDDHISHARSLGHPGVVSVPAAMALGEHRRVSGETFVAAVVHGYEVTSRLNDVVPAGFDCFALWLFRHCNYWHLWSCRTICEDSRFDRWVNCKRVWNLRIIDGWLIRVQCIWSLDEAVACGTV